MKTHLKLRQNACPMTRFAGRKKFSAATLLVCCAVSVSAIAASLSPPATFTGACDASAVLALNEDVFAVANDEDNLLRFYRLQQPGRSIHAYDLKTFLDLKSKAEADLEGIARMGKTFYFISSHGRNAKGKEVPNRHQFFALDISESAGKISVLPVGKPFQNLLAALEKDSRFAKFELADAAGRAPKAPGGLNIEGLAATPDGALLIGFRSPIPGKKALVIPLLNPREVVDGKSPKFGDPILLDLGGLGVRAMESAPDGYYVVAGPDDGKAESRLFFWKGDSTPPKLVNGISFATLNPEGMCVWKTGEKPEFLIVSDDGTVEFDGTECKDLPEGLRRFRACRFSP